MTGVVTIPASPSAPAQSRRLVDRLGLDDATAEVVRLVVSELVSNAVMHGAGPIGVSIERGGEGVHVTVTDEGAGFAAEREAAMPPPESPDGRGLALVSMLAARWGVERGRPHRVWCVIPAGA